MHKNWNYSNKPLANLESLFKMLETNEERLTYLLKNKKKLFQNGAGNKKRQKKNDV